MTTGLKTGQRQHAKMHPLTKARVDAQAQAGRALGSLCRACTMLGTGEVTDAYVTRHRGEYAEALQRLVEAAQAEGAGE